LVLNLCEFQERFAQPMLLPFQLGNDLHQRLQTRRPLDVLLKYNIAFPLDGTKDMKPEDGCTQGDKSFCWLGKETWQGLVRAGKLEGTKPNTLPVSEWIKDLFELFEVAVQFDFDRKADARRLAACWYHVATQLDFGPDLTEEEGFDPEELIAITMSALTGGHGGGALADLFPDEGNDDSEPDEDYDPTKHTEEEDENDHILVDEDHIPEEALSPGKPTTKTSMPMDTEEPTPKEQEVRAVIFRVVQALGAYMPSPVDDLGWFKRVLKHVTSSQTSGDTSWYHWGCPPINPLVTCLKSEDPHLVKYASVILSLFQAQQQSTQESQDNVGSEEDVDDSDFIPT